MCQSSQGASTRRSARADLAAFLDDRLLDGMLYGMGTDAWRNWRGFDQGNAESENVDEVLYSDRHFVGGPTDLGPFVLTPILGLLPPNEVPLMRPAVLMRVGLHENLIPDIVIDGELVSANSDYYHGGNASDEIATLTSLELGVRLRVAGTSRMSLRHEEGSEDRPPIHVEVTPLTQPGRPGREYIPAVLTRPAHLDNLVRLATFPSLDERAQVELVRAAGAYAAALWWSNEDPNQAWLQLVTAIEIAAGHRQTVNATSEQLVEALWPELWSNLKDAPLTVRASVAKQVAPQIRATRKFVDFLVECTPEPPTPRPSWGALDWDGMADHAKLIYRHRSVALHSGKPFPMPMLDLPRPDENGAVQEVPFGLNSGGLGGVWDAAEVPMLLPTFEHIARGALLTWWDELISRA